MKRPKNMSLLTMKEAREIAENDGRFWVDFELFNPEDFGKEYQGPGVFEKANAGWYIKAEADKGTGLCITDVEFECFDEDEEMVISFDEGFIRLYNINMVVAEETYDQRTPR